MFIRPVVSEIFRGWYTKKYYKLIQAVEEIFVEINLREFFSPGTFCGNQFLHIGLYQGLHNSKDIVSDRDSNIGC